MKGKTRKQKHLIHLHQNNYEAKRWKSGLCCACLRTNTPAATERKIKIKEKVEKPSRRKITIRKNIFSFLCFIHRALQKKSSFVQTFLVFIEKYADFNSYARSSFSRLEEFFFGHFVEFCQKLVHNSKGF